MRHFYSIVCVCVLVLGILLSPASVAAEEEGILSHGITIQDDPLLPNTPSSVTAVSALNGITLSWTAPTQFTNGSAIPVDAEITYNVYRLMKRFNHYYNFPPEGSLPEKINSTPIAATSYLDNDLWVAGTQYHYMVTAVVDDNESGVQAEPASTISQMNPANGSGQVIPNDTDFSKLWHLHNTGQTLTLGDESTINAIEDLDIDAPEAWAVETGDSRVIIAVMGYELLESHKDLAPQYWINEGEIPRNSVDDDANDWSDDYHGYPVGRGHSGHELSCAAAAGAAPNDSWGVVGVAPDCRLMSLPNVSLNGINFGSDRGVRIFSESYNYFGIGVNMTLGSLSVFGRLHDSGCVYFGASSLWNERGERIGMTARNIGPNWTGGAGSAVEDPFGMAMPVCVGASNVWLPHYTDEDGFNAYGYISGLSYGIPQLAGVAGLIRSYYPEEITTPEFIYETIMLASEDITSTGAGIDSVSGFGMLNAAHALKVFDGDVLDRFEATLSPIEDDRYQLNVVAQTESGEVVEGMTYAKITAYGEEASIQSATNNVIGPFSDGEWTGEVTLRAGMGDTIAVSFADVSVILSLPYIGAAHVLLSTTPERDTATLGGMILTLKETTGGTMYITHSTTAGTAAFSDIPSGNYSLLVDDSSTLNCVVEGISFPTTGCETTPIVVPALIPGDANNDNIINDFDKSVVTGVFGSSPPTDPRADINRDGTVDLLDLEAVEHRFGMRGESLP